MSFDFSSLYSPCVYHSLSIHTYVCVYTCIHECFPIIFGINLFKDTSYSCTVIFLYEVFRHRMYNDTRTWKKLNLLRIRKFVFDTYICTYINNLLSSILTLCGQWSLTIEKIGFVIQISIYILLTLCTYICTYIHC